MSASITRFPIDVEQDVVTARQRARQIARLVGFDIQDQARIATAVSEIARNAVRYAGRGEVEISIEGERAPQLLVITVSDRGPGIAHLAEVLGGRYRSPTGMGLGVTGARRLVDQLDVQCAPGAGTVVSLRKIFPPAAGAIDAAHAAALARMVEGDARKGPLEELQQQHRELLRALAELQERQDQLGQMNRELEDTNRGVVALYAELDQKADHLRRADEMKSKFLSNMSHEFRTPLNSIRALSGLLLDCADGPLLPEQQKQVGFIRKSAEDLSGLVEDLLDLAKIEAGKIEVHPVEFTVDKLFSALRGMLRPLLLAQSLVLRFEAADDLPALYSDEGKVSQILRNFISNALKYTERGDVLVRAELGDDGVSVVFSVADTGIGIAVEDQERIFLEFEQVRGPLQQRIRGTGLGLPLCRRLAALLGGSVGLTSTLGIGSTFTVAIPVHFRAPDDLVPEPALKPAKDPWRLPVLVVEDEPQLQFYYEKIMRGTAFQPIATPNLRKARQVLRETRPVAIVLDIVLKGEDSWRWLSELKGDPLTSAIPVIIASEVDEERKGLALGADAYLRKPIDRHRLLAQLKRAIGSRILIIDDDAATRYALRRLLDDAAYNVIEAADGSDGLSAALSAQPEVILLDLGLPDMKGDDLLRLLKESEATRSIPVVVATACDLSSAETDALRRHAHAVLSKRQLNDAVVATVAAALRNPLATAETGP